MSDDKAITADLRDSVSARGAVADADRSRLQSAITPAADVTCRKCSTVNARGVGNCVQCGRFLRWNQEARTTGVHASLQPAELRQHRDDFVANLVSDLGGESELTTLQRAYTEKLGDIEVSLRLLTHDIATNGLLTGSGRVRDSYEKLLAGLAAFDRYAQRVGLERRQKRVATFAEAIAQEPTRE